MLSTYNWSVISRRSKRPRRTLKFLKIKNKHNVLRLTQNSQHVLMVYMCIFNNCKYSMLLDLAEIQYLCRISTNWISTNLYQWKKRILSAFILFFSINTYWPGRNQLFIDLLFLKGNDREKPPFISYLNYPHADLNVTNFQNHKHEKFNMM